MNRRNFLRAGATLAASLVMPVSGNIIGRENKSPEIVTIPQLPLNNGLKMPMLGFGTLSLNDEQGISCVANAIALGYRLIDTATIYGNEEAVGQGIKKSGVNRSSLFLTSKLWVDDYGYEKTLQAFNTSLNKLQTNYLDLYLLHRPRGDIRGAWRAMESLYAQGKIKAIGISNFDQAQLQELMSYAKVIPVINQIETHAFYQHMELPQQLTALGVKTQAWSPLASGRNNHFTNSVLASIGQKYGKSNAQVSLRWHYQRGIIAIPRSSQVAHMKENLAIFDFKLSDSDMQAISRLDLKTTQFPEWS
ncbi:MAG: aldo/keto reductase [Colwellia sp.]